MKPIYLHAAHMEILVPEKRKRYLRQAKKAFRAANLEFDSIAFSGMSGAMFAPLLAHVLKKELVMVRKGADLPDRGHSAFVVEGYAAVKRYVIVDDLVSTGATVKYIHGHILQDFANDAKCVGVYCYLGNEFKNAHNSRVGNVVYCESSVPKIAATDDPTVARETAACGCGVAQACSACLDFTRPVSGPFRYDSGRKIFMAPVGGWFGSCSEIGLSLTSVSDIPDGTNMEDAPSEPELDGACPPF